MRGAGFFFDLLTGALAIASLIGFFYFWYLCFTTAVQFLEPLLGEASFGLTLIGLPFVFGGILLAALYIGGRGSEDWILGIIGIGLPLIGIWAIKKNTPK